MLTTYLAKNTEEAQYLITTEGCLMPSPELVENMHPQHKIHIAYRMCAFFTPKHAYEYLLSKTIEECYLDAVDQITFNAEQDSHLKLIDITYLTTDECIDIVNQYGDLL